MVLEKQVSSVKRKHTALTSERDVRNFKSDTKEESNAFTHNRC